MKTPPMTILPIGKRPTQHPSIIRRKQGFTFIEVMVSLVILSVGIVSILKVFIFSLDQLSYLGNRVYATLALDNKMVQMSRVLQAYNTLKMNDISNGERIDTGAKEIDFKEEFKISDIAGYSGLFLLDSSIAWDDKNKHLHLSRSMYLSNIHLSKE